MFEQSHFSVSNTIYRVQRYSSILAEKIEASKPLIRFYLMYFKACKFIHLSPKLLRMLANSCDISKAQKQSMST